jgi:hypothetical protein
VLAHGGRCDGQLVCNLAGEAGLLGQQEAEDVDPVGMGQRLAEGGEASVTIRIRRKGHGREGAAGLGAHGCSSSVFVE